MLIIRKKEVALQDSGGDERKKWLIRYYTLVGDKPLRVRECIPMSLGKEERYRFAEERIAYLRQYADAKGHICLPESATEKKPPKQDGKHKILEGLREAMTSKLATVSERMVYSYRPALRHFTLFVEAKELKKKHIGRAEGYLFRNYLIERGLTKKTVNNYMSAARELFTEGGRLGLWEDSYNPLGKIPLLSVRMQTMEVFAKEHLKAVYDYMQAQDRVLLGFVMMMFYTCNRPNALRLLKVGDVDLGNRTIRFVAENQKTGERRFQKISDAFFAELVEMRLHLYPQNYYLFGHDGTPSEKQVGINFFSNRHREMLSALGLKKYGYKMYAWKHTGAVYLYNSIRDLKRVSEHLFHTDIKTTLIYLQRYGVVFGDSEFEKKAPAFGKGFLD